MLANDDLAAVYEPNFRATRDTEPSAERNRHRAGALPDLLNGRSGAARGRFT
jgi:hypothetical protein